MDPKAALLLDFFVNGKVNCAQISRETGINERCVQRLYQMYRNNVPFSQIRGRGRPQKIGQLENVRIGQFLRRRVSLTSTELAAKLSDASGKEISPRTMRNHLQRSGYRSKPERAIPVLNATQKIAREKWAREHLNFDFKKVIFSDESTFELHRCLDRVWSKSRGRPNRPRPKYSSKRMVWGAINYKKKSSLQLVDGTMNSDRYVGVINRNLIPMMRNLGHSDHIFQQDNAPCHTSRVSKEHFQQRKVQVLAWPSNSPDLNPIENIWAILKKKVARILPSSKSDLDAIILEEWDQIPIEIVQNLIDSMPRRLQRVIDMKGEYIGY